MEYVDIYTAERKLSGVKKIKGSPLCDDEFILIAHLVIFNSRGEMLIQKRKEDKKDWPGCWDITSGGGVRAGETSYEGAVREISEELGLSIALEDKRPIFTIDYPLGFDDYFIITKDVSLDEVTIQPEEVTAVRFASYDEIKRMTDDKGFIDLLFSMRDGRGSYDV